MQRRVRIWTLRREIISWVQLIHTLTRKRAVCFQKKPNASKAQNANFVFLYHDHTLLVCLNISVWIQKLNMSLLNDILLKLQHVNSTLLELQHMFLSNTFASLTFMNFSSQAATRPRLMLLLAAMSFVLARGALPHPMGPLGPPATVTPGQLPTSLSNANPHKY